VLREARGSAGFGYDPLFVPDGAHATSMSTSGRTFAELSETEKNEISHRGIAVRALVPHVEKLVTARLREASEVLARAR
jgi:XTP/dITP diphosphohydrolase